MNIVISDIISGLKHRTRDSKTIVGYKSKMKRIGEILEHNIPNINNHPDYTDPFIRDNEGNPLNYNGTNIKQFRFPITKFTFETIIALLTIESREVSTKKRKANEIENDDNIDSDLIIDTTNNSSNSNENENEEIIIADSFAPAKDIATISAGSLGNYKSALKWFYNYEDENMEKVKYAFPEDFDDIFKDCMKSYKRDIGRKRTIGK